LLNYSDGIVFNIYAEYIALMHLMHYTCIYTCICMNSLKNMQWQKVPGQNYPFISVL